MHKNPKNLLLRFSGVTIGQFVILVPFSSGFEEMKILTKTNKLYYWVLIVFQPQIWRTNFRINTKDHSLALCSPFCHDSSVQKCIKFELLCLSYCSQKICLVMSSFCYWTDKWMRSQTQSNEASRLSRI